MSMMKVTAAERRALLIERKLAEEDRIARKRYAAEDRAAEKAAAKAEEARKEAELRNAKLMHVKKCESLYAAHVDTLARAAVDRLPNLILALRATLGLPDYGAQAPVQKVPLNPDASRKQRDDHVQLLEALLRQIGVDPKSTYTEPKFVEPSSMRDGVDFAKVEAVFSDVASLGTSAALRDLEKGVLSRCTKPSGAYEVY